MKRVICAVLCAVMMLALCACSTLPTGKQPGSVFPEDTRRFVLVDSAKDFGNRNCYVYADKTTGVMYLYVFQAGGFTGITPLFNSDGTPILYDED